MAIQNLFTSRDNNLDGNTYVGQLGRLWYNPDTNSLYASDGVTVGGIPVDLATNANILANNLTVTTITSTSGNIAVTGNLVISGNISPATDTKVGGIKAGPGANVSGDGTLTIDTSGLPLSFGDFTANVNILTLVNADQNMILATQGNAEVQLVGNIGFYRTNGFPPDVVNRYFSATDDGQLRILVSNVDPTTGAVEIIGSTSGQVQSPINTGVMLHITGQNADPARLYVDGVDGYAGFIGRRYNGNAVTPTAVSDGDEIARFGTNAYTNDGWLSIGQARISIVSTDNQSNTAQGAKLEFWSTPKGDTVSNRVKVLELNAGVGANVVGNVTTTGNIAGGNLILSAGGLISSTGLISTTGNISAGNVNSYVVLPAGTTAKAPLVFTSGTLLTASVPGSVNYDGSIFYATPQGQERGIIKTVQTFVLNSDYALIDQTAVQPMFGVSAAVSSATRYAYVINAVIYKTANNITMSYAIDGTSVLARHTYQAVTSATVALGTVTTPSLLKNILTNNFSTGVVATGSLNGAGYYSLQVSGVINVTTGGTWDPLVAFSGLPGAGSYVAAGSSIEIYPIGPTGANVAIGNWT